MGILEQSDKRKDRDRGHRHSLISAMIPADAVVVQKSGCSPYIAAWRVGGGRTSTSAWVAGPHCS